MDPTDQTRTLLQHNLVNDGSGGTTITRLRPRTKTKVFTGAASVADIVVFGVRVTEKSIIRLATTIRAAGLTIPIFVLTEKSENGIVRQFKKAGVDDMLHVAEINTPLIAWTFMSSLKQAEVKKKATEFDQLSDQIKGINNALAFITHEINNPLSVMRLAMYHFEHITLTPEKRKSLLKIISDSLDKIQSQTEELRNVRRALGNGVQHLEAHTKPGKKLHVAATNQ